MTIVELSNQARRTAFVALLWGGLFILTPLASLAAGTATLAWDPSAGTNVIANYKVYYGVASATYTNVVSAGTNITVSISNLVRGTTYYFAATAIDTFGLESDYSTEVSALIPSLAQTSRPRSTRWPISPSTRMPASRPSTSPASPPGRPTRSRR